MVEEKATRSESFFPIPREELCLSSTLSSGQSFRWRQPTVIEEDTKLPQWQWAGVINKSLWLLRQTEEGIYYNIGPSRKNTSSAGPSRKKRTRTGSAIPSSSSCTEDRIVDYFRLDYKLVDLYSEWGRKDSLFKSLADSHPGIRLLRQDPTENLFSFICSQNNNISRITGMIEGLCAQYGEVVADVPNFGKFYSFPDVDSLNNTEVETHLGRLGFGYRARYVAKAATQVALKGGSDWLNSLRLTTYPEARSHLMGISGVGPKVADCICLMSLDKLSVVPVDTHVFQIAQRDYKDHISHLKLTKTLTDKSYSGIARMFGCLYGPLAGWAQCVLFMSDLKIESKSAKRCAMPVGKTRNNKRVKKGNEGDVHL